MRIRPPNAVEVVGKAARPVLRRMAGCDAIGVLFVSAAGRERLLAMMVPGASGVVVGSSVSQMLLFGAALIRLLDLPRGSCLGTTRRARSRSFVHCNNDLSIGFATCHCLRAKVYYQFWRSLSMIVRHIIHRSLGRRIPAPHQSGA